MPVLLGAGAIALASPQLVGEASAAGASATSAAAVSASTSKSPYYGRWTVEEDNPVFTSRGRLYKTIDVAPCGRDFCGVSVDESGRCGVALFRFMGKSAGGVDELRGRGKWGDAKKNIVIYAAQGEEIEGGRYFEIYLGDGHDFGERSGNMPKFHANYRHMGEAKCSTA
jgi:hypothetical protein